MQTARLALVLFALVTGNTAAIEDEREEPSPSVHTNPSGAQGTGLRDSIRLGVYMLVDRNISDDASTPDDNFTSYAAALVGGVNARLQDIKNTSIKLGLLRVIVLGENHTVIVKNESGTLNVNETLSNLLSFNNGTDLRRNESDIVYLITRAPLSDSTATSSGWASPGGACTENKAGIHTDVLGSFAGAGAFMKNILTLLGGTCEQEEDGPFKQCQQESLMENLKKVWPRCYGHSTYTQWVGQNDTLPSGPLNETLFCQHKGGSQESQASSGQADSGSEEAECRVKCHPHTHEAPDGTRCRESLSDVCQGSCFKGRCVRRGALLRWSRPDTPKERHLSLEWSAPGSYSNCTWKHALLQGA